MAMARRTVKRTTPTPSLNRLSPFISVSSAAGTRTTFSVESTATGSVGLISAPKTNAQGSGIGMPSGAESSQMPTPTTAVETTTLAEAISATDPARPRSSSRSTCSAPANRRKASIPPLTVAVKSIWRSAPVSAS
jgi:hypothetical protein